MLLQVPSERVLVVYDDLDIATAVVRLRAKGGHGGHNGMRSLCQHLGGNNFPRIRIGQASGPASQVASVPLVLAGSPFRGGVSPRESQRLSDQTSNSVVSKVQTEKGRQILANLLFTL